VQLEDAVVKNRCDVGIIYDGDADRVNFVDEKGRYVYADIMMAVLGIEMLKNEKGKIVADIRSSRSAVEYLEKLGGEVYMWKVGHVNAKAKIREIGAIYGGELAGHYYFRDFFNCDSAMFATLHILPVLSEWKKKGHTFSELLDTIIKWKTTGEINFKLEHKDEVMAALYKEYAPQTKKILDFDGYRFDFPTWWFNIRKSNTEPYLRLVLEAKTQKELDEKLAEVKKFIHD
jgi:phosphomannomutase